MTSPSLRDLIGAGLEEVLGQMPAAVFVVEAESRAIVYVNARAQVMTAQLGRAVPPELTEDWEIFRLDGRPYAVEEWPLVRSLATGEEVVDEEYYNVGPDGERLYSRSSSAPIYGDDGEIVAGVLIVRDVTEQKGHEERLRYLAGLLDNTEDAIVAYDAEWFVTVWNKGAERLYGWTADEILGRHTLEVARLEMSYEERAEARRAVVEQGRWRGEVVAYRKDGAPVRVELITVALRGERDEVTGYIAIDRDVAGRRQAEEALREARERTEAVLESITDAFVALDRHWRYTDVNDRGLRRLAAWRGREVTREEIIGRNLWELFPEAVGTEVERRLRTAMDGPEPVEFELYFAPTDEWVEARAHPSAGGLSIFYRSVSARRRAEQEMERRAEQQTLVAALGRRALTSDDLPALLDEAVHLVARTLGVELVEVAELGPDGEQSALLAGVGRREGVVAELNVTIEGRDAPFGVLSALSSRARVFSASEVSFVQAVANVLASAVERARAHERLIEAKEVERRRIARDLHDDALQDLTHALALAAGAAPGPPDELIAALKRVGEQLRGAIYDLRLGGEQQTPFRALLESLIGVQRAVADDCEIALDVRGGVPAGPLGATGIETLRILGEALTNARRHARARHVRVRVWTSEDTLGAEVSDDGEGFDPADRAARFPGHGMTGMRERAERIHARLDIVSDRATGTTVRLEVPIQPAGGRATGLVRVLLVEDHTAVRQAIAAMFERESDFVVAGQARSLAEARELLHDVDVALIDLGLPDGDGADLIPELRAASPGAQALVLSADLDRAQTARAIEAGAAGALAKTADLDQVVDAIRRLRAGQSLLAADEVVDLLRFAGRRREQEREAREAIGRLTAREREVLRALGAGLDGETIAKSLGISIRTQRNHVARILGKLGVHSQLQAVLFARRHGLTE